MEVKAGKHHWPDSSTANDPDRSESMLSYLRSSPQRKDDEFIDMKMLPTSAVSIDTGTRQYF